ncbi:phage portal protein [Mycolicibacterium pallens]|uniref:Phage portal protein n=1 Tax=Mycolicibacterium pallens TaxID=370524 RepID=A0ABX8VAW7_9MYCO|nr:phage portal protein [Mycolicibacterium pallens]QYL14938.1 phage portal protein [Mycolicibacterium pallens]
MIELLQALDAPQHKFAIYGRYYRGENQSLGFVSPESQAAIGHRLSSMVVNIPRVLVNALAERCRILGFDPDETIWRDFIANDLDQQAGIVHRSALLYGQSFVIVWGDGNRPIATVESPLNVQVLTDPATGVITSAVKRYTTKHESHAYVYLPTEVQHWRAKAVGAASSAYELVEKLPHHMGMVPVVRFLNADLIGDGVSEISDIMKPSDGLSKISTDMLVGSEFYAKPRRVLTGVEMVEVAKRDENGDPVLDSDGNEIMELVSPVPDNDRLIILENEQAKATQLAAADLAAYKNAADLILSEIASVSSLPPHYLGILHDNPSSADSLRASEAGLTSKASSKQNAFGRSWETVGRLMKAVRTGANPADIECKVTWCDPATRSESQAADAVVKLVQAGILSKSGALRRLGYTQSDIEQELYDAERDALANANPEFSMAVSKHAELMANKLNEAA